jgi:hypothetical protein
MGAQPPFAIRDFGVYRKPVLAQFLIVEIPILIACLVSWWIAGAVSLTYFLFIDGVLYFSWWAARRHSQGSPPNRPLSR